VLAPDVVDVAYRVVQEGLTNALKHAPGAKVQITLKDEHEQIQLTVLNGCSPARPSGLESSGGGFGLDGMSERVVACGGTLHAGPTAEGGWCLTARLPSHGVRSHPQGGRRVTRIARRAGDATHDAG
jgi:signal transduction histidine kinase